MSDFAIGLVGAGEISKAHIPHLLAMGAEVFVYSTEGAEELVALHGGTVVDNFDELLKRVDIVDVVVPTHAHFEFIERAVRAGKDVISEKPLALLDADASSLLTLVAETGRTVIPAHVVRYFPEYWALKQAVDRGDLGDLAVLRFSRWGPHPMWSPWFRDPSLSGGIVMDFMIHDLDIARWVAGEVTSVSAAASSIETGAEPMSAAHVTLVHESGAISQVSGLWGSQNIGFVTEFAVAGTLGTLQHSSRTQRDYLPEVLAPVGPVATIPDLDPLTNPYSAELHDFVRAFQTGSPARVSIHDGIRAVQIANAANASIAQGQPVKVNAMEVSG